MIDIARENVVRLNKEEYADKVYACWIGKNIGGTMGTPYEGKRELNDIRGFVTKENEVLPNDDLDLQLVWLHAVEEIGPHRITPLTLGEFWTSFIVPHWNEYGIGKNNMRLGLVPPLSGDYKNSWKDSNGAWIRTEIWASLCPASPDLAMKFSYCDACVDHGHGEGTVAAMFVAAVQSAAYVISDFRTLLNIGLSKIPAESRVSKSIQLLLKCYDEGKDWKEARNAILESNADLGDGWFEAPSNVAYAMLGILYGECDFKKSLILAINCGDDTDCTGATAGALLGIMGGTKAIPEDWRKYLGDDIVTVSVNKGCLYGVPKTCTELTGHVVREAPIVLASGRKNAKFPVEFTEGKTELSEEAIAFLSDDAAAKEILSVPEYSFTVDANFVQATVSFDREPTLEPNSEIGIHVTFKNNYQVYGNMPHYLKLSWILPEGFEIEGPKSVQLLHFDAHSKAKAECDFTLTSGNDVAPVNRLILEAVPEGRPTDCLIPIVVCG